jgi:glycine oxidase
MGSKPGGPHFVVIGGGVAGACAAFFISRAGCRVTLIERDGIAQHASGRNPGGLNPLFGAGIPGPLQALALESFRLHLEMWDDVARVSDIDFRGRFKTRLNVALDMDDVRRLESLAARYEATSGLTARWLEARELRKVDRRVSPDALGGLSAEGDAKVNSAAFTRAVVVAACRLGATSHAGEVTGLTSAGSTVSAVQLSDETIACDGVALATGPWVDAPSQWVGLPLPVEPVKGEMLLVEPPGGAATTDMAWRDAAVYETGGSSVWLGGTEAAAGFDDAVTDHARAAILERVSIAFPGLGRGRVFHQTAGLRPVTPDGLPVLGIPPGWDNVCLLLGGGRKGMLLGPAMGQAAADLLVTGATGLTVAPCSPSRFVTTRSEP